MKKLFLIGLAMSMGIVFTFTSCGGNKIGGTVDGKSYKTEGWIDDDTFRIAASGAANSKLTNQVARRESSKQAAKMNAQYQVLGKMKGATIEGAAGMSDFESTGIAVSEEVNGVLKGGSVIEAKWDDDDNCEIIYEVKSKGLKKKVTAEWK